MDFNEILTLQDKTEQMQQQCRAFTTYTAMLDVTGNDVLALIAMVSLTLKRIDVTDLLDKKLAKLTSSDSIAISTV